MLLFQLSLIFRFYSALSKHLNSTVKEIYTSVAEVIGMSLNLLKEKKQVSLDLIIYLCNSSTSLFF